MGNCCFGDEKSDNNEPNERTRLLAEPARQEYIAPDSNIVAQNETSENDDQAILSRIVQEAQESLIDVSAFDQHALEHHEYVDRSRMYATRINNEFERQIRDAIQKTSRARSSIATQNGSGAVQRFTELQTETLPDDAELMQQLSAEFHQRLSNCGIKSTGDLVVRVTGERNGFPIFGQPNAFAMAMQNNGPNGPQVAMLPNSAMMNVVANA